MKPIKRICLFTATGAENLGDELITLTEIQHLQKLYQNCHITVFSHDVLRTRRFLLSQNVSQEHITLQEYFPNYLRKRPFRNIGLLWKTLVAMKQCQHIYVGGGGLLYGKSEEGHSPLRLWSMRARLAKFFRKSITYLSLGISAGIGELKPFARTLFTGTTITVRENKSQEILTQLGFHSAVLPDPVLSYVPQKRDTMKTIGIAFRKGFLTDEVIKEIIKKLINIGYEILLLPHSLHPADENSHDGYYLQDFLFPGVGTTQTIEQTLEGYKKCHIILAMRLHSMILAVDNHTPFIGISYSKKTDSLLENLDWKYALTSDTNPTDIIRDVLEIEKNYPELEEKLTQKHLSYQTLYINSFPGK